MTQRSLPLQGSLGFMIPQAGHQGKDPVGNLAVNRFSWLQRQRLTALQIAQSRPCRGAFYEAKETNMSHKKGHSSRPFGVFWRLMLGQDRPLPAHPKGKRRPKMVQRIIPKQNYAWWRGAPSSIPSQSLLPRTTIVFSRAALTL
jgi:hypothetical protein